MSALVPYVAPTPAQEVKVFDFEPTPGVYFHIRTVWFEGKPWFVAADVCRALGLSLGSGTTTHLSQFGADEVRRTRFGSLGLPKSDLGSAHVGPNTPVNLISESGLYKLVMRSDKETARKFQDWAARHVFPGIRQDGMYVLGEEKVATGEMHEDGLILRAMEAQQRKVARYAEENARLVAQNAVLAPKAAVVDATFSTPPTTRPFGEAHQRCVATAESKRAGLVSGYGPHPRRPLASRSR